MVSYGIAILPRIKNLKSEFPDITQPLYAEDSGALDTFTRVVLYFNSLKRLGLGQGYCPKPSKSVLVMHMENIESGKLFGLSHGFKFCTGARYLGGLIGDDKSKYDWLKKRKET